MENRGEVHMSLTSSSPPERGGYYAGERSSIYSLERLSKSGGKNRRNFEPFQAIIMSTFSDKIKKDLEKSGIDGIVNGEYDSVLNANDAFVPTSSGIRSIKIEKLIQTLCGATYSAQLLGLPEVKQKLYEAVCLTRIEREKLEATGKVNLDDELLPPASFEE